jgi:hypothetical protein
MAHDFFVVRDGLIGAARFPPLSRPRQRISAAEVLLLLTCGAAAAAAVGLIKLRLGIPGHAIVLSALPMALGMALAPRRFAGTVMSAGALGAASLLAGVTDARYGSGSFVSLSLLGPMMDIALRHARAGWPVYAALVASGVATNLLALGSRAAAKLAGLDLADARPFDSWWLQAMGTYTASGIVAGVLGALCWFHFHDRSTPRA